MTIIDIGFVYLIVTDKLLFKLIPLGTIHVNSKNKLWQVYLQHMYLLKEKKPKVISSYIGKK